jgi:hypothetical protein
VSSGILASRDRPSVVSSTPRIKQAAYIKLALEAFFFVYAAMLAAVSILWLFSSPAETRLHAAGKSILTLPSLVFQFLWARTCWVFYSHLERGRGGPLQCSSSLMVQVPHFIPLLLRTLWIKRDSLEHGSGGACV